MSKYIDRAFGWLLALGGILHAVGALKAYEPQTAILVWSLSGSLAALLLAAINLLRVNRPKDRMLAWVSFVGCLFWLAIVLAFGQTLGTLLDPRVIYHAIAALVLSVFSARMAFAPR